MKQTGQVLENLERSLWQNHSFYEDMHQDTLTFVAHRGGDGAGEDFENTLAAFEVAENSGVNVIETDIVNTLDGVAVHFHGNRQTRKIVRLTEYSDLNSKSTYKKIGFKGDYIPTLGESLDFFPGVRFFLDLKSKDAPPAVVKEVKRAHAETRVSIDGEHWKRAVRVLKELPDVSTTMGPVGLMALYASAKNIPGKKFMKQRYLQRAHSLSLPVNRVERPLLDIAHEIGVPVFLYRVNNEADIDRAVKIGARGIMADNLKLAGYAALAGASMKGCDKFA